MSGKRPSVRRYIRRYSMRAETRGPAAQLGAELLGGVDTARVGRDERIRDALGRLRPGRTNAREERRAGSVWVALAEESNRRRPAQTGAARRDRNRAWRHYIHVRDRGDRALVLAKPRRRALVLGRRTADSALRAVPSVRGDEVAIAEAIIRRRDVQHDLPRPAILSMSAAPTAPRAPSSV